MFTQSFLSIFKSQVLPKFSGAALISVSSASVRHQLTLSDHRYGDIVDRAVCLFAPRFSLVLNAPIATGDGQAELTWMAGYIPRCFYGLQRSQSIITVIKTAQRK